MELKKVLKNIINCPEKIKKINLSENYDLTEIPEELKQCSNLESLDVSFCVNLKKIPDFIYELPNITSLKITNCSSLVELPEFRKFKYLKELSFSPKTQKDLINVCELTRLTKLTIDGPVSNLPSSINFLSNLKELHLFATKISNLPESLSDLHSLKKLTISQLLFSKTDIPTELDFNKIFSVLNKQGRLQELNLNYNKTSKIPNSIGSLTSLTKLSFNHNELENFPVNVFDLEGLIELDFGANNIATVPMGIGKLKNLKTLRFNSNWKNKLKTNYLFAEIHKLQKLETIDLSSCQSEMFISDGIKYLHMLKKLDLRNNKISILPDSIFNLQNLKMIDLSYNLLSKDQQNQLLSSYPKSKVYV